jgi:glycerol-3-phosphate dehydrogenase
VTKLHKGSDGLINGLKLAGRRERREFHDAHGQGVVNATGAFTDSVRQLGDPAATKMIAPSQGAHIILDRSFLPGNERDPRPAHQGRTRHVRIPWHDHTLVGTTDMPLDRGRARAGPDGQGNRVHARDRQPLPREKADQGRHSQLLGRRASAGEDAGDGKNTAALSRDHTVHIDQCGLLSIAGGKWTTYRNMAQDAVNQAATLGDLPDKGCVTTNLNIHGYTPNAEQFGPLSFYGTDAAEIRKLIDADPTLGEKLDPELPYVAAEIVWAAREEMARTLEDVLARRTRALFLNSKAALRMAPKAVAPSSPRNSATTKAGSSSKSKSSTPSRKASLSKCSVGL